MSQEKERCSHHAASPAPLHAVVCPTTSSSQLAEPLKDLFEELKQWFVWPQRAVALFQGLVLLDAPLISNLQPL